MRIILWAIASLIFVCPTLQIAAAQGAAAFQFQFTEQPGPYPVGLTVVEQYDRSRSFQVETAPPGKPETPVGPRPLQTLVWYPANPSSSPTMAFGDYGALIKTETSFGRPVEHGKPQSFIDAFMQGTTALHASAIRDAAMHAGQFPVVIYAPSLNAPATENIELCEYLASAGFVVIASPSMGESSRFMTVDVAGANAEARDISLQIDFARTLPDTKMSAVAVMGYSWGGMAALFAAARNGRIGALISLDGSFRYSPDMVAKAGDVHPDKLTIPLLVFSRAEETLETWDAMRQDKTQCVCAPNVLNQWTHGDLVHVRMLAISHVQFSSIYQRSERFRKEGLHFVPPNYSLEDGDESYNWMARYSLEFLEAYLKHDAAALTFLKHTPTENGVPRHLMVVELRQAAPQPKPEDIPPKK
ncbi:MAG: dienelactone hydrolase family protein [Terracidiphilus sp.]